MNNLRNIFFKQNEKFYINRIEKNPDDLHSLLRLGELYIRKGQKKKGLDILINVSKKYFELGKTEYSLAINKNLKKIFPDLTIDTGTTQKNDSCHISTIEILKNIEIFKNFTDDELLFIEENSKIREYHKNDVIVKEGEDADSFFVILKGNVKVYITTEFGKIVEVCILGKGDFFGEMSFFENSKRYASVDAIEDSILLEIPRNVIEKLKTKYNEISDTLMRYYENRAIDIILSSSKKFSALNENVRKNIIENIKIKKYQPFETIIKQGDYGNSMYIIKSGVVEVFKEEENGETVKLAELTEGEIIGEIGVLTGQRRTATVIAKTEVELLELEKEQIDKIILKYPQFLDILKEITQERITQSFMKQGAIKKGIV